MIILTVSRRTKLAAAEMKDHMTAGHKHYAFIYLLLCPCLTCIYTFTAAVADICGPKWPTKKCVSKPLEPIGRRMWRVQQWAVIMCHWTMLEPCSCVLSHTAACWPLPAGDTVMMQSCVVVCSLWTLIWWLVTQLCLVTLVHCFPQSDTKYRCLLIYLGFHWEASKPYLCCITQNIAC